MPRGFLAGLVLGGVAGGAALAVISLTSPIPQAPGAEGAEPAVVRAAPAPVDVPPVPEAQAPAEEPSETLAEAPMLPDEPQPLAPPAVAEPLAAPDLPATTAPEAEAEALSAPVAPETEPAAEQPAEQPVLPETAAQEPQPLDEASPLEPESEAPALLRPAPGLAGEVNGVQTDRLPRIGDESPAVEAVTPQPALSRYARSFANPSGRPPFALLLLDDGQADAALLEQAASVQFPLTLVIDPAAKDAVARAALWRAAGQEVAILAAELRPGATAGDAEVSLEALNAQVPEALALVTPPGGGALQSDRAVAGALVPALRSRGFGLVTWDQGVNSGDQVARREGLPAAVIYRDLNGKGEAAPVITRYLDRAAFKAQQDGRAVVMGRLDAELLTLLIGWSLTGRAASLSLAPLSATLN